ncbi:hypothetical protein [Nostoc sp.]
MRFLFIATSQGGVAVIIGLQIMDINQQKEQFSISYIRAIAALAGYSLK